MQVLLDEGANLAMGEALGRGIDRQDKPVLGTRFAVVGEDQELARHELAVVIVAHGTGDEQQLALADLALEEWLAGPGALKRAALVAERRAEHPQPFAGRHDPRARDAAYVRHFLPHV